MLGIRRARVPPGTAELAHARTLRLGLAPVGPGSVDSAVPEDSGRVDVVEPIVDEEVPLAALEELRAALADQLPATVRGGRFGLSRAAAIGLAVVAAAAVALTLSFAWRARAVPVPLTPTVSSSHSTIGSSSPATSSAGPNPQTPMPTVVVVDVAGKVRHPGVVRLPSGSRVVDAISAAGGALHGVDLTSLNLAAQLQDGQQVLVGVANQVPQTGTSSGPTTNTGATATSGPLDLNSATLEELESLPGIGPSLGQRILDWRTAHGRFTSVQELREVSGIGDARFADLSARVRV